MTLNYNEKQTLGERHATIKEMESQDLTSSEKLHAQRIIHDVNNCLMVLMIQCDQIKQDYQQPPILSEKLQKVIELADQTAVLGRKININSANVSKPKKVEINQFLELITSKKELLHCLAQNKFRIDFRPLKKQMSACLSEAKILIEEDEIPLILLQLIRNSMDAFQTMKEVPKTRQDPETQKDADSNLVSIFLTITNGNQKKFDVNVNENPHYSGYLFQLHVQDNGPGFSVLNGRNPLLSGVSSSKSETRGYGLTSIQHILNRWNAFILIEEEVNGAHISLNFPILKR
jgi:nitrogen-specific signal transduction histidine kinase